MSTVRISYTQGPVGPEFHPPTIKGRLTTMRWLTAVLVVFLVDAAQVVSLLKMQRKILTIGFALMAVVVAVSAKQDDEEMVAAASEEVGELDASATEYGYHHYSPKHHYKKKHGAIYKHKEHGYESYAHNTHDSYIPKKVVSYEYKHGGGYGHGYKHPVKKVHYGYVSKHGSDGYTKFDHNSYDKYQPIQPKYVHIYEHHESYPKHHSYKQHSYYPKKHHSYKPYEHHTESHGYESYHSPKHYGGYEKHHGYGGGYHHQPHYNNHYVTHGTYKYVDHDGSMGHYDGGHGYTKVHGSYSPHHQKMYEKYSNSGKHHSYY